MALFTIIIILILKFTPQIKKEMHTVTFSQSVYLIVTSGFKDTVLPVKSDSGVMFCLQSYKGLRIDRSHVY